MDEEDFDGHQFLAWDPKPAPDASIEIDGLRAFVDWTEDDGEALNSGDNPVQPTPRTRLFHETLSRWVESAGITKPESEPAGYLWSRCASGSGAQYTIDGRFGSSQRFWELADKAARLTGMGIFVNDGNMEDVEPRPEIDVEVARETIRAESDESAATRDAATSNEIKYTAWDSASADETKTESLTKRAGAFLKAVTDVGNGNGADAPKFSFSGTEVRVIFNAVDDQVALDRKVTAIAKKTGMGLMGGRKDLAICQPSNIELKDSMLLTAEEESVLTSSDNRVHWNSEDNFDAQPVTPGQWLSMSTNSQGKKAEGPKALARYWKNPEHWEQLAKDQERAQERSAPDSDFGL